ncbi:MAG: hypothetical protein JRH11_25885, partial [Deltaproteobacteria bacterium]|nr:hypothetical protein [Deltaproteobacteria bacterium]
RAVFVVYATAAAFATYFGMYAFRKPFAAATFEGQTFFGTGLDLKTAFVISQILGYTLSKYAGIKVVSEITPGRRAFTLVGLIAVAELALVGFGFLPVALMSVALFVNGLALGMIWGLVVRYLEGRQSSELLLAGLSTSFILASGAVKDIGRWLITDYGVAETWMPAVTGAIFFPIFVLAVWLLDQIPDPTDEDKTTRVERRPMDAAERRAFLKRFAVGLVPLFGVYIASTAYRDFRDNYGVEIFAALGYDGEPGIFTQSEIWVALGVLAVLASLNLIKDNRRGLAAAFGVMIVGAVLIGGSTVLLDAQAIDGMTWMILVGLGSYFVYVPFNTVLFDRMIAATRVQATAVFAIYIADALGYTGSIGAQLYKDFGDPTATRLGFFRSFSYGFAVVGAVLLVLCLLYFWRRSGPVSSEA